MVPPAISIEILFAFSERHSSWIGLFQLMWTQVSSSELSILLREIEKFGLSLSPKSISLPSRPRSLIQSLPNEIWSEIFMAASHNSNIHDSIASPIIISHVCQHWRRISLSTSALWATVLLTHPSENYQLSRTVTWLMRSRRLPLHIHLDFRDPTWNWEEGSHTFGWKNMENVIRLLLPQVSRWETLKLLSDTWAPIYTFLRYTSRVQCAPRLKTIELSRCNAYFAVKGETFRPVSMKEPVSWFSGGKALAGVRRVLLAGVHVDWSHSGLSGLEEL
ncbi:hypothetical protein SERLA73DRAFT_98520, partial [Serpula lacrymans var. lacrymans S7.3]